MTGPALLLLSVFIIGAGCGWILCLKAINHAIKDLDESERIKRVKQFTRYPNG